MPSSVFRHWCSVKFLVLGLVFLASHFGAASTSSHDRILLSDVNTLTLYSDRMTNYRRTKAYPQLACVGGDGAKYGYRVDVMQCKNMGGEYDREDVQWSCTTELPDEFKLGKTEVVCEGYTSPDDAYVLKGSCGVEYTLMLTSVGRNRYVYGNKDQPRYTTSQRPPTQVSFSWVGTLFRWIKGVIVGFFGFITRSIVRFLNLLIDYPLLLLATIWACYKIYQWTVAPVTRWFSGNRRGPRQPRRPWWSGFFGGGGPGGGGGRNDDRGPPPPYTYFPPGSRKTYHVPPETQVPRPGFWTGFASGGAAGYGVGRSSATRTQEQQQQQQPPPQPPTETRTQAEPSGWFWNVRASNRGSTEASGSHDGSTSDRGSGSGTHTSTGFGGTKRR